MLLDLNQNTVSRLGLEPIKNPSGTGYLFEGCIPSQISSVEVDSQKYEKGEFAGKDVPVLKIEFTNFKLNPSDPDRFLTHSFKPIGTKQLMQNSTDTYEDRPEVEVIQNITEQWQVIKHFLESLVGSPNYRNVTKISKEDLTKYFNIPSSGTVEVRLAAWLDFYTYLATFINGDGNENKSQIFMTDNKPLPLWVKALPNYSKELKRNAKYYEISRFIGQGVFETMKFAGNVPISPKVIRVKPSESLALASSTSGSGTKPPQSGGSNVGTGGAEEISDEVKKMLGL